MMLQQLSKFLGNINYFYCIVQLPIPSSKHDLFRPSLLSLSALIFDIKIEIQCLSSGLRDFRQTHHRSFCRDTNNEHLLLITMP